MALATALTRQPAGCKAVDGVLGVLGSNEPAIPDSAASGCAGRIAVSMLLE